MQESQVLTNAVRLIRGDHACIMYNIGRSGTFTNEQYQIKYDGEGFAQVPAGMMEPVSYLVRKREGTYVKLRIVCRPITGMVKCNYTSGLKARIPVYDIRSDDGVISSYEMAMEKSLGPEYLELPEPDEEGNYIIPPEGGKVKACRK